jgi:DNA-binding LytR/AlgR family response regulator
MKVVIVEDEKPAARRLQRLLEKQQLDVQAVLHSVQEAVAYLSSNHHPELIFLDIQLSDGLSFEIFEHIELQAPIIFTTAYDEYALQAFKLNSIDYLLKPIDEEELQTAVNKWQERYATYNDNNVKESKSQSSINHIDLQEIASLLSSSKTNYKTRYTVKIGDHIKLLGVDQAQLFFSENKGSYLQLKNGRSYLLDKNMDQLEQELDPDQFYRISRQAIINVNAITDLVSYSNSRLKVIVAGFNNYDLIVSRERVKEFKAWLDR